MEKSEIYGVRHSISEYKSYKKILDSDNPQGPIEESEQEKNDLSKEGIILAEQEAEKLLSEFNPDDDGLFFVSSGQVRAMDTASIYMKVAERKGFEIVCPKRSRSAYSDEVSEGRIRKIKNLSLRIDNVLVQYLFMPTRSVDVDWEKVPAEARKKWEEARKIVENKNYGNWGANFFHYSEELKKFFPEIKSAKDTFDVNFKNLLRLIRFGHDKIKESGSGKNIKVMAFGHENYIAYALNEYFGDHEIKNCEAIKIDVSENSIAIARRGEKVELND
ncbi:MAG: hypothetical protein WC120_03035 [Parcubacteria group bacterium]